jgi:hypothetical protein
MKIKLKKKENQYAQVHVNMLRNKTLSLKAKGLGAVLESYSDDFEVSLKSIELNATDGIKSVRTAIKELEDGYYLFRFQTRDKGGLFSTYWAFDSQKLDVDYLREMIKELEKVELITKNELLQRGIPHGNAVTGMPSTASRSTASRQSTTYNNTNYKNKEDKNNILEKRREEFEKFRNEFKKIYTTEEFFVNGYGFDNIPLILNLDGLIMNSQNFRFLPKKTAFEIWDHLFNNQEEYLLEVS